MKKKIKNIILYDNKGIAMTEVVVAFLLLTILLGLVYSCIRFSSQMTMKATDTDREYQEYSQVMSNLTNARERYTAFTTVYENMSGVYEYFKKTGNKVDLIKPYSYELLLRRDNASKNRAS